MKLLIVDFRLQIDFITWQIGRRPRRSRTSRSKASSACCAISAVIVLLLTATAIAGGQRSQRRSGGAPRAASCWIASGPEAVLILWSAPTARYSNDIDYKYRQDSNLYYLTGVTQPDTMLILMRWGTRPAGRFCSSRTAIRLKNNGPGRFLKARTRPGPKPASASFCRAASSSRLRPRCSAAAARATIKRERRRLASSTRCRRGGPGWGSCSIRRPRRQRSALTPPLEFARQIRDRFVGFCRRRCGRRSTLRSCAW